MIGLKVFRRRNITACFVPLHLPKDPAHVVFRVAEVHQLALVWRFKDGVPHLFAGGEQPKPPLALSVFHRVIGQPRISALGTNEMVVLGAHEWVAWHKAYVLQIMNHTLPYS